MLILALTGSANADVCVVATPGVTFGCESTTAASSPQNQAPAPGRAVAASVEPSPFRASSTAPEFDPHRVAVTFKPRTKRALAVAVVRRAGGQLERLIPAIHAALVGIDPAKVQQVLQSLNASPAVVSAGREPLSQALDTTPNDSAWPEQVGLRVAGFPRAWDEARGSPQTVVAVVDTGVDPNQPDLHGAFTSGYDFVNGDANPSDDEGHGTAVAGIIGARSDNHLGVAGVCWSCTIMPIKVLDANGVGDDSTIAAGVVWAVDHGADIVNLSLGGTGESSQLSDALAYAARRNVIVVAAAGNDGKSAQFYPAADANALSVAATNESDAPYSWTNFGPWVDVAAPGCNIASQRGGGIVRFCGTSSATPVVAGLAALARSTLPGASAVSIEHAIEQTTTGVGSIVRYGRIDAARALAALQPPQVTQRFAGTLRGAVRRATFAVDTGDGTLTAVARASGNVTLSLTLQSDTGATIATASGRGTVTLQQRVAAGRMTLIVSRAKGSARMPFTVTATYSARP